MECHLCKLYDRPVINEAVSTITWNAEEYKVCKEHQKEVIQLVDDYTASEEFDDIPLETSTFGDLF